jgi:hypothetical protein
MESDSRVRPRRIRLLVGLDNNVESRNVRAPLAQDLDHVPQRACACAGEQQLGCGEAGRRARNAGLTGGVDDDLASTVSSGRHESLG